MRKYIIRRILLIFPTLLVVSLVIFLLSKYVPNDPVVAVLNSKGIHSGDDIVLKKDYQNVYNELGLHKPNFYFSILPQFYPNNVNALASGEEKELFQNMLKKGYDSEGIQELIKAINVQKIATAKFSLDFKKNEIEAFQDVLGRAITKHSFYYPKIIWQGFDNQYHNWIKSFFSGGFGLSITDGKTALSKVSNALKWTLSITLIDLILSIILAILVGKLLVKYEDRKWAKFINQFLYLMYAIPIFWLATLLVVYLTTDDYGSWTNIFPSVGIDIYPGKSTFQQIALNSSKLILPVFCLTVHSLAYATRFLKRSISDELNKDYVSMAFAKGLTRNEVIDRHVFKNALIAFITVFVSATVAAFGGSLVIEVIFNIPGIGRLLFNSISNGDWNVIFCIVMILALITTIVYLIGDVLYAFFSPKLRFRT